MTVPEDSDDRSVLDILGFGTPANPEAVGASPESARPSSPSGDLAVAAPLTRRELRERERAGTIEPVGEPFSPSGTAVAEDGAGKAGKAGKKAAGRTRRGASSPSRPPRAARRTARATLRRDAVRTTSRKKTFGARLLSFGAMLFAGALAFGMTVPANAFDWTQSGDAELAEAYMTFEPQSAEVDPTMVSFAERDAWTVTSWAEMLRLRYGSRSFDYAVGTGPIRWPFPYAVPISSGFGDRAAPCRGCSTAHSGIDFTPGYGAAIFAIADGTVVDVSSGGTSWGTYVVIQHEIDGQTVFSGYAHMVSGSTPLVVGDPIKVGDFVGLVGATGQVTGAHLHFTIAIGDRMHYVDPFTFLKTYAS